VLLNKHKCVATDIISEQHGKVNTRGHILFSFKPSTSRSLKRHIFLTANNFVFVRINYTFKPSGSELQISRPTVDGSNGTQPSCSYLQI